MSLRGVRFEDLNDEFKADMAMEYAWLPRNENQGSPGAIECSNSLEGEIMCMLVNKVCPYILYICCY